MGQIIKLRNHEMNEYENLQVTSKKTTTKEPRNKERQKCWIVVLRKSYA